MKSTWGIYRIVVYNPLPWMRDGEIELDTRLIFGNDFVSLKPVDGGTAIAVAHVCTLELCSGMKV